MVDSRNVSKVCITLAVVTSLCFFLSACKEKSEAQTDSTSEKEKKVTENTSTQWKYKHFAFNSLDNSKLLDLDKAATEIFYEVYMPHLSSSLERDFQSLSAPKTEQLKYGYTPAASVFAKPFFDAHPKYIGTNLRSFLICYTTGVTYNFGSNGRGTIEECGYFMIDVEGRQIVMQIREKNELSSLTDLMVASGFIEK